jgi:PIN domain nuclease of toxin-antitoxin system
VGDEPVTVLDTHALVWWLADPAKLSLKARRAIQSAASAGELVVSAASVLEIATLVRRGRLTLSVALDQWLSDIQSLPELRIEPVTAEIAARAGSFDEEIQGDPIDRVIIATALLLRSSIVSADTRVRSVRWLRTIW